jgi:hypothetical protein
VVALGNDRFDMDRIDPDAQSARGLIGKSAPAGTRRPSARQEISRRVAKCAELGYSLAQTGRIRINRGNGAMVTLRRTSVLVLVAAVVAVMGAAPTPAHAATPEAFGATGAARALHISVLGKDATFGVTDGNVGAPLTAVANAAGQLLQPNSVTKVSLSKDNSTASDPTDGKQKCAVPSLPAPLSSLLDTSLACSLAKADIANGLPHAVGTAGVASIDVNANTLLKSITDQLKLGATVQQVKDQLAPVLDAVSKATGNTVNLNDTTSTVTDLLNALTTQQTLTLSLGQSTSDLVTAASSLSSTSTALGGQIKLLPIAALGNKPLATITIGSAKATASYDRATGKATPTIDPALVTVELGAIGGLPGQTIKIAPGQTITLLAGTPLESTITVADGTTSVSGNTAKAVADGVSLQLLKGLSLPTSGSSLQAAATGPGAVVVELAHAEAQVTGTPAVSDQKVNPAAPPAAEVKALAFTGPHDWMPFAGVGLIGAAYGVRRLRRKVTA